MMTCEVSDSGAALEVKVRGPVCVANARSLQEELATVAVAGRDVVIDLDAVDCLDGAGVQLLVALKAFVERQGGALRVATTADVPTRALEIAGASKLLGLE